MVSDKLILDATMCVRRGTLTLRVAERFEPGETVALVGRNGAGKSSLLHALAGLVPIDEGRILLGQRLLDGGPQGPWVPPRDRGIGVVFQDHLLFPTMTVLENVAYSLRCRRTGGAEAVRVAREWLDRVGMSAHAADRPMALSGGQSQRVALARALAMDPDVLLLDEPLASVDASGRVDLRRLIREHLQKFRGPRILVAHTIDDAIALADRILVLDEGQVLQSGSVDDLATHPKSQYVADLVGVNRYFGNCKGGVVNVGGAEITVASDLEGRVVLTIQPRAIALFPNRPEGSPRNVWQATVAEIEPLLERVRVRVDGPISIVAEVTPMAVSALGITVGCQLWVAIKATEWTVSPA